MWSGLRVLASAGTLLLVSTAAQKPGGILKIGHFDSPASMTMLEESTAAVNRPMMGVFNNPVIFNQDVPQNTLRSIVPELATGWAWNKEGTELTSNVEAVTPNGDYEVSLHLKQPRPGRYQRGHATPARRAVGSAAGDSKNTAGPACIRMRRRW